MLDTLAGLRLPFRDAEAILLRHDVLVEELDHLIDTKTGTPAPTLRLYRESDGIEIGIQYFKPDDRVADYILWKWAQYFMINPSQFGITRV